MEGMLCGDFDYKLRRLNPGFWSDRSRTTKEEHEYSSCGLYLHDTYILGVPHKYQPRWSLVGIDYNTLRNQKDSKEYMSKSGYIPDSETPKIKLLWRGYQSILTELCRRGIIDKHKTEKLFKVPIDIGRMEHPKNFIQMEIS